MRNGAALVVVVVVFALITRAVVDCAPVTDFRIGPSDGWRDFATHRFYGPWPSVRKRNGDYADYADYGAYVPGGRESTSMNRPIVRDYSPAREMGPTRLLRDYGPSSHVGLASFRTGVHPDHWLSKCPKGAGQMEGHVLPSKE